MSKDLTAERLRELFSYSEHTGIFTRRVTSSSNAMVGSIAGGPTRYGYWRISIDGGRYQAHRLAWLYVYGHWPKNDIDHINGDRLDNRISNLRDVCRSVNNQNRRGGGKKFSQKLFGAFRNGSGYMALIKVFGKSHYLGTYRTPDEAHAAYIAAKRKLHEGCTI